MTAGHDHVSTHYILYSNTSGGHATKASCASAYDLVRITVEPPNNGHIGSRPFVRCREVSLSRRLTHSLDLPLSTLY